MVMFMKKLVLHQSPQYMTSLDTAVSWKQSLPKIFAKPRGIIRLPPSIDITVDLQAPFAPTTRMRAPRSNEKLIPFTSGGWSAPRYEKERFVTSRVGPSGDGAGGASVFWS